MLRAAALAILVSLAAAAPAGADDMVRFTTPSKKIACAYMPAMEDFPAFLRCDLFFRNDTGVFLKHKGKAKLGRVTDTVAEPGEPVLQYGKTWSHGGFTCLSKSIGLRCRSKTSGHGFFVSRQKISLY